MSKYKIWSAVLLTAMLQGCFDGDVSKAKNKELGSSGKTYEVLLTSQANCVSVKWTSFESEDKQKRVKASCTLDPQFRLFELTKSESALGINRTAENYRSGLDGQIKGVKRALSDAENQLAFAGPDQKESIQAYRNKLAGRLQSLEQAKPEFDAFVDSKKAQDLTVFEERFGNDSEVLANFIFVVGKESAQLDSIHASIGKEVWEVPGFDALTLMQSIAADNRENQFKAWRNAIQPKREYVKNLYEALEALEKFR